MTTYSVHKQVGTPVVGIYLKGYGPSDTEGFTHVGDFDLDIDPLNQQTDEALTRKGDHIFVVKAREVVEDHKDFHGINVNTLTFLDRATNAATHQEEFTRTDDLPVTEEDSDPDASSQAGGEHITDDDKDGSDLDPNGVTEARERTDAGDTDADASERDEERSVAQDLDVQHDQEQTQEEVDETDEADEKTVADADENQADGTDASETIPQLKERIAGITDKDELQKIYEEENAREKPRAGAVKAIEDRAAELEAE